MWDERRVDVAYRRGGNTVERVLGPLGLVLKAGVWYLVAGVPDDQGGPDAVRTYRVSRVVEARPRPERFDRPLDFDLAAHWASSSAQFETQVMRVRVEARIDVDAVASLRHVLEPGSARVAQASVGATDDSGWASIVIPAESIEMAYWLMLRLGPSAEVLAPVELRDRLATGANELARRYGTDAAAPSARR